MLWAFLPWSILLIFALVWFGRQKQFRTSGLEWYCMGSAIATFLVFSFSRFQLPYYLNFVFPFFAIILARYLLDEFPKRESRSLAVVQYVIMILLLLVPCFLQFFYQPGSGGLLVLSLLVILSVAAFFWLKKMPSTVRMVYQTSWVSFVLNVYLNIVFYPSLLSYQAGSEAAFWINRFARQREVCTTLWPSPYIFYLHRPFCNTDTSLRNVKGANSILYISDEQAKQLVMHGRKLRLLKTFDNFPVSKIDIKFLNSKTRPRTVEKMDIVQLL